MLLLSTVDSIFFSVASNVGNVIQIIYAKYEVMLLCFSRQSLS